MPKLKNSPTKELFGYQVDKENDTVFFNDSKHLYLDKVTAEPYISTTTLIHFYEPEFNELFFARYKALEELADADKFSLVKQQLLNTQIFRYELLDKLNIDRVKFEAKVEELKEKWRATRDEACEHGTFVHEIMESSFYGKTCFDLSCFGCPSINGEYKCIPGYYPKKLEPGIYPEYLISWISPEGLHISGQIDVLVCDNDMNITIIDWKTNKEIKKRGYYNASKKKNVCLKYPLNNLESCSYNIYQLQLSTYAYMIKQLNPDCNIKELKLVHIDRSGKQTIYQCQYLEAEVERMIKHYVKQQKINAALDLDKPFIK